MDERDARRPTRVGDHPVLGPVTAAAEVEFAFDGRPIRARAGEPLLAALLAAGVRAVRTMPVSGEARGGWCLVGRCPDCAVVADGVPNVRACLEPVRPGMRVETQRGLAEGATLAGPFVGDSATGGARTNERERDRLGRFTDGSASSGFSPDEGDRSGPATGTKDAR